MTAFRLRTPSIATLLLLCAGCHLDTQIHTEISEDGSVKRTLSFVAEGMDKSSEKKAFPGKQFVLPASPQWTISESTPNKLVAQVECKPGAVVPGGYERPLTCLKRISRNAVQVLVRDHYLATSYLYEERFVDTVDADEFKTTLAGEYDRASKLLLAAAQKEFAEAHDLAPVDNYLNNDLRKLIEASSDRIVRSGVMAGLGNFIFRLAMGGFFVKNINQLMEADPREVIQQLFRLCLEKMSLKPDRLQKVDEEAYASQLKNLQTGSVDEQAEAGRKLKAMGPAILRRLDQIVRNEVDEAGTGARERIKGVAEAIRAERSEKLEKLVARLAKETEDYYLDPANKDRSKVETDLARMLGAHIEGNFAPCEYLFLSRVKLPGDIVEIDLHGRKLQDGTVRWNFTALQFFIRDKVCRARSRIWNEERIKKLGVALAGGEDGITLRRREEVEKLLADLDETGLSVIVQALTACGSEKNAEPLKKLSTQKSDHPHAAACAEKILELLKGAGE